MHRGLPTELFPARTFLDDDCGPRRSTAAWIDRRAFLALTALTPLIAGPALAAPARRQAPLAEPLETEAPTLEALLDAEGRIPVDDVVIPPAFRRQVVAYDGSEEPGTVVVRTRHRFLYLVMENGEALRYGCGIGRQGFSWSGRANVGAKQIWPDWYPPQEMRDRQPELPEFMPGGPDNPLGARALYLYKNNRDTLYRIHGTREARSIGRAVSSGCVRLMNDDIIDLYDRVPLGTPVVVT
ncbi:L,D-transpeptidase [Chelatococcus sp. SYSU_G07232]|uniref:L,D-transpeptidase n=1 Tax=Chelatococcus albus TaxID=3047466 RepID=A0ABT7AEP6_9HYPH|nr:L,D-transpeptidase [Chelatococcus sp. SYSU_G07232]MDJ1157830.1 L,D-transpeptidase [Chelatococcus sp. SYSU_G07232]